MATSGNCEVIKPKSNLNYIQNQDEIGQNLGRWFWLYMLRVVRYTVYLFGWEMCHTELKPKKYPPPFSMGLPTRNIPYACVRYDNFMQTRLRNFPYY